MLFDHLGLRAELLQGIEKKGYREPTPIQTKAIPAILDGRDVLARAQTGTGKTDAFALPLVEILSRNKGQGKHPRALVLTPTRELALQVGDSIKAYARRVDLRCTVVYGGVRIESQISRLKRGIDILVATPGRLLDLAGLRFLKLSRIEFLVFDEADRMLDLGFSEEISAVLDLVPAVRRTMLFSATYTQQIRDLAGRMLQDPQFIEVTPENTAAESVVQKVYRVDRADKRALFTYLVTQGKWGRILVFTRTKHGANKLSDKLTEQGINSAAMHGNMSQSLRSRTLDDFKNGRIRVLVATDVAARGLDIRHLPYVVNYDMPSVPEDYVHRIGRTGRAGVNGVAISLVSQDEVRHLRAVEKLLNEKIPVETVDGYTEDSVVPDYVLYRPNHPHSELTADKEIKEIVARRAAAKQRSKERKKKTAGSGKTAKPKSTARKTKPATPVKNSKMKPRGRKAKVVGSVKKRNPVKPKK